MKIPLKFCDGDLHVKIVWANFEKKKDLGKFYNLHVQSNTLLSLDFFGDTFSDMFLKIYGFYPLHFNSEPG